MIADKLFDQGHFQLVKRALTAYAMRHRVVADNIANQRTEGFRAQEVDFESLLKSNRSTLALQRSREHDGHLPLPGQEPPSRPQIAEVGEGFDNGINDVDIDREMGQLAQNALQWNLATRMLSKKYERIRTAITGQIRS